MHNGLHNSSRFAICFGYNIIQLSSNDIFIYIRKFYSVSQYGKHRFATFARFWQAEKHFD